MAWTRASGPSAPASGRFATPADLGELETVEAPLGPVTLDVSRGSERLAVAINSI